MFLAAVLALAALPDPPMRACAWVRAANDGAGAGFVVDAPKRLLVTCRHVVADRKAVEVFFPWVRDGELVTDRAAYLRNRDALRARGLLVSGTVHRTSDALDLALVELDSLPEGTRGVTLAARAPQPGEPLRVVGHRTDLDTLWNVTRGPLRASGMLTDGYYWRGKKLAVGANALIAQLPTEEGDSGGPVFDSRGEVVGIACALRRAAPLAAVAVSAAEIRAFLGAAAEPVKPPEPVPVAEALTRATVWVRPTATDVHSAGALIEPDLVLTAARGMTPGDRVGVALPLHEKGRWVAERAVYSDPLGLFLRGAWRSALVVACDSARDLALVRLDAHAEGMTPLRLAVRVPAAGAELHAMSHPGGLEFAWVYASGSVRQRGRIALDAGERSPRVDALICQLPAQGGSPGGPIVDAKGELVGVLASREGAQQVGYAATADEVRAFLDAARRDRPPATLTGLLARLEAVPAEQASLLASALARRAEQSRAAGRSDEAAHGCAAALAIDPGCAAARLCRSFLLEPEAALAELDAAVGRGPFHRGALARRAALALAAKDFRKARGDAERILGVFPADAEARELLARSHLGLGDESKAAAALGDAVRADPQRLPAVADIALTHAEALEGKFASPGVAADWLALALAGVQKGTRDPRTKAIVAEVLKTAAEAKDAAARLKALRAGVQGLR